MRRQALTALAAAALLLASTHVASAQPHTNNGTQGAAGQTAAQSTNNGTQGAVSNNASNGVSNNASIGVSNNASNGSAPPQAHPVSDALRQKAREATALLQKNQLEPAEKLFVEIYAEDPAYEEAMFNYALLLERTQRTPRALEILTRLTELRPDSVQPWFYLASFHQRNKDNAKGLAILEEATRRFPNDPQVHNRLAQTLDKDPQRAIAAYKRALELDPADKTALNNLGALYIGQNRYKDAVAVLERYTELYPRAANGRFNLANALLALGQHDKTIALYEDLTVKRPGDAFALSGLILAYTFAGRYDDADKTIAKAQPTPETRLAPQVAYAAGVRWLFQGNPDKAEPLLTSARKELPAQLYEALAWAELLRARGRLDDAEKILQEKAANPLNAPLAQPFLALIALDRNQPEQARKLLDAAISAQPDYTNPRSLVHLARVPPAGVARLEILITPPAPAPVAPPKARSCACSIPAARDLSPLALLGALPLVLLLRRRR